MSLFTKHLSTLKAALEGIGFDVTAIGPETPAQLAAHMEQQVESAQAESVAALAEALSDRDSLKELLDAATAAVETHTNRIEALNTALAAIGLDATTQEHQDPAALAAAVQDRVSLQAAEQLAAQGQDTLLDDTAADDTTKPASQKKNLTGRERAIAHWNGQK